MWLGLPLLAEADGAFLEEVQEQRLCRRLWAPLRRPPLSPVPLRPRPLRPAVTLRLVVPPVSLWYLTRWRGLLGELSVSSTELSSPVDDTPSGDLGQLADRYYVTDYGGSKVNKEGWNVPICLLLGEKGHARKKGRKWHYKRTHSVTYWTEGYFIQPPLNVPVKDYCCMVYLSRDRL